MAKEINGAQLEHLLLRVRELVTQYKAARQTLQRTERDWRDIYARQLEGTQRTWDSEFGHLLAMTRDGDFSGALDKLNEDLGTLKDVDE